MQEQKPMALQPVPPPTSIQADNAFPAGLPEKPSTRNITEITAVETKPESLPRIGLKGYLRLLRVLTTVFLFGLRVIINTRGWRIGKKIAESELRRREGGALREKLLKLGPTFIKIG